MRAILCPADTTQGFEHRLEAAQAVARSTGGHVSLPIASPMMQIAAWEPFGGVALTADAVREMRAEDETLARHIDGRLARGDVPFDVTVSDDDRFAALSAGARFADLIVLGRDDPVLEDLVLSESCPVLALPPHGTIDAVVGGRIVIAWDGSSPAANAMKAAVPLLAQASRVDLVTVNAREDACDATKALCYLSRHGVHADLHRVTAQGSVAEALLETAHDLGAGLLVMGLYGHSRLRELLVGGVTRAMVAKADVALLLAH